MMLPVSVCLKPTASSQRVVTNLVLSSNLMEVRPKVLGGTSSSFLPVESESDARALGCRLQDPDTCFWKALLKASVT